MGRLLIYALGGGRGHATRAGLLAEALGRLGHATHALVREGAESWAAPAEVIPLPRQTGEDLAASVASAVERLAPDLVVVDVFPGGLLDELRPERGELLGVPVCLLLRMHQSAGQQDFKDLVAAYALRIDLEPALEWLPEDVDALPLGPVARAPLPRQEGGERRLVAAAGEDDTLISVLQSALDGLLEIGEVDWLTPQEPLALCAANGDVVVGRAGYNLSWETALAGAHHVALPAQRRFDDQDRRAAQLVEFLASPQNVVETVRRAWAAEPREPLTSNGTERVAAALDRVLRASAS